jgi:thymidylate synthase, flavin-dependent
MEVKLLDHTKLSNAVIGARTCWNSFHKGGNYDTPTDDITDEDKELLERLIHKNKHESIAEHITNVFKITGITRMVLIELTRHRVASYSVKSTRYTLKELRDEAPFLDNDDNYTDTDIERASKYIDLSSTKYDTTFPRLQALENLRQAVINSRDIDEIKYLVPECYLTDLVFTINARSLKNFLNLRLSKSAHYKIKELAKAIFFALPQEHRFLYAPETEDLMKEIEEVSKNNDFENIKPEIDDLIKEFFKLRSEDDDAEIEAREMIESELPRILARANASEALKKEALKYVQNIVDEEMNEIAKNNDFERIKPLLDDLYEQYINLNDGTEYGAICAEEVVAYGLPDIFAQANASKALREKSEAYFQNLKDNS